MAVHSFVKLMDESPIIDRTLDAGAIVLTLTIAGSNPQIRGVSALLDESAITPAGGESVTVTADPIICTIVLAGTFQGHLTVVANPITVSITLQGSYREPTGVSVTADPIEVDITLGGLFYNTDSAVDSVNLNIILEGRVSISPLSTPPRYKIELRNTSGVLQFVFMDNIENVQWTYLRKGGCEQASFTVIDPPTTEILVPTHSFVALMDESLITLSSASISYAFDETQIQNYDVRIYLDVGAGMKVWWRGHIEDARLQLGDPYKMVITAKGDFAYLERASVVGLGFPSEEGGIVFEDLDATTIAKRLIDRVNALGVGITYTNSSTPDSGFIIEAIQFNSSVFSAIKTLGELAGDAEWGVDRNKEFFFRDEGDVGGSVFLLGKDVAQAEHSYNTQELINRIYLIGGDGYKAVIEDTSSLTADQSQILDNATQSFGQATSNQRLCQTFTTTRGSLSAIDLKIAKTGWGSNLVTDGDMELNDGSSPANWGKLTDRTRRIKWTSDPHAGTRCLDVHHSPTGGRGRYGVYQDITVTANQEVQFFCWLKDPEREDPIEIELVDGSAYPFGNTILDTLQGSSRRITWYRSSINVTPTTTTLGIRIYARNKRGGTNKDRFFVDDVFVQTISDLSVSVVERLTAGPPPTFDEENLLAQSQIDFEDITTTAAVIQTSLVASPLDSNKTYGIIIESSGELSDTKYFILSHQNTLTGLFKDNGDETWNTVSGKAYFKTYLPSSQITWGIRSEVMNQPHISNDEDAALWGASVLAVKSSPIERASVTLRPNRNILVEEGVPMETVRIASATSERAVNFTLLPERISYSLTEAGLETSLELGSILPRIGRILQFMEFQLSLLKEQS